MARLTYCGRSMSNSIPTNPYTARWHALLAENTALQKEQLQLAASFTKPFSRQQMAHLDVSAVRLQKLSLKVRDLVDDWAADALSRQHRNMLSAEVKTERVPFTMRCGVTLFTSSWNIALAAALGERPKAPMSARSLFLAELRAASPLECLAPRLQQCAPTFGACQQDTRGVPSPPQCRCGQQRQRSKL